MTLSLDLYEVTKAYANDERTAIVTRAGGETRVELPYVVYQRTDMEADGRTYNFFTRLNELHEGQTVAICSVGILGEESKIGTVERAQVWPPNKWFVQTQPQL